jgi:hypothetical protein
MMRSGSERFSPCEKQRKREARNVHSAGDAFVGRLSCMFCTEYFGNWELADWVEVASGSF